MNYIAEPETKNTAFFICKEVGFQKSCTTWWTHLPCLMALDGSAGRVWWIARWISRQKSPVKAFWWPQGVGAPVYVSEASSLWRELMIAQASCSYGGLTNCLAESPLSRWAVGPHLVICRAFVGAWSPRLADSCPFSLPGCERLRSRDPLRARGRLISCLWFIVRF